MVKLTGQPGDFRRQSFRGTAYVTVRRGTVSLKAWPRKRKRPLDPVTQENNEKFRQASMATKVMSGDQINMARRITVGTNALPRDILIQTLYGRTGTFIMRDGKVFYSMATKTDMDLLLDVFGNDPGSILYRTDTDWVGLLPGPAGSVLVIDDEGFPAWDTDGGGSGGGFFGMTFGGSLTRSTASRASKGQVFTVEADFDINGVRGTFDPGPTGDDFSAAVYRADASGSNPEVTEVLAVSPVRTLSSAETLTYQFDFDTPVEVTQGDAIIATISRRNAGGTASIEALFCGDTERIVQPDAPVMVEPATLQWAKEVLEVGDTPDASGSSNYVLWPVGQ